MTKVHGGYSLKSEIEVTLWRLTRYGLRGLGKKKVLLSLLCLFTRSSFSCVTHGFRCLFLVVCK